MVRRNFQKTNTIFFFCFLLIAGLYFGAPLLIPITFAIFLSTLMIPVSKFFEAKVGVGRITSSFISTLILFLGVGLVLFFLFRQLGVFLTDLIERNEEIAEYVGVLQERLMSATGFTLEQQKELYQNEMTSIISWLQGFISGVLASVTEVLVKFLLVLIYVFLFLINRDKFKEFLMMYIPGDKKQETEEILSETKKVAHKYLWGRIQVMILLAILYTIVFTAYGVEHTPLLILFGTVITIVPYIGPLISGMLPILFMIVFGGSYGEIVSFIILVTIIQLMESYLFEPIIIGSEVQQSPLFIIIAVLLGGALWGAAGLILFVPIFGIIKIFADHNKELRPIGFLMGYKRPGAGETMIEKLQNKIKK
ncbi:AI-2E family transporter [Salegentibacter sp. F188]|uniref:AI-2E family transporter n=1 Tax=Autumnicola patrickiae TaxID=3075591 RepID=A0ABU3E7J6_9FLAO|nr:AI-2E family transporter [Salegentibacter sp. F188]MDT0691619.1 AI-2E family transporter [Salegentibacter sp. F188]